MALGVLHVAPLPGVAHLMELPSDPLRTGQSGFGELKSEQAICRRVRDASPCSPASTNSSTVDYESVSTMSLKLLQ